MSEKTKIEWAMHTGGPYLGCSPVSPGCGNCYAWALALARLVGIFRRAYKKAGFPDWETRPVWGDKATRVLSKGFWNDARRINAAHAKAGTRGRWFPSMIDWLDLMPGGIIDQDGNRLDPIRVLADFLKLVYETQSLDWLLLTKRPELWPERIEDVLVAITDGTGKDGDFWQWLVEWFGGKPPANVWPGASVEDQPRADERIPQLLRIPAKVRFLSVEPLLGPIDFLASFNGYDNDGYRRPYLNPIQGLHWIIAGGESGPSSRPCNIEWIRSVVRQFKAAGVPVFVKQLGSLCTVNPNDENTGLPEGTLGEQSFDSTGRIIQDRVLLKHPKGGDPSEWPEDLRVREFPNCQ